MLFLPRLPLSPPGQFLLEQTRLGEAAEMAERAAELDSSEFDVVFSAAHMLRLAKLLSHTHTHTHTATSRSLLYRKWYYCYKSVLP